MRWVLPIPCLAWQKALVFENSPGLDEGLIALFVGPVAGVI